MDWITDAVAIGNCLEEPDVEALRVAKKRETAVTKGVERLLAFLP